LKSGYYRDIVEGTYVFDLLLIDLKKDCVQADNRGILIYLGPPCCFCYVQVQCHETSSNDACILFSKSFRSPQNNDDNISLDAKFLRAPIEFPLCY
jgi:hypothetical protein